MVESRKGQCGSRFASERHANRIQASFAAEGLPSTLGGVGMRRTLETVVKVESEKPPISPADTSRLLRRLANRLRVSHDSIGVLFSGDARLKRLNSKFRGKNRPTDVLSFPAGDEGLPPGAPRHLGDIVISTPTTRRQAMLRGVPAGREARVLLIHGLLHLLGYDHETDDGEMEMLERTLGWEVFKG